MREPLPLATIHDAVLEFLRGRDDAVLYGAQAVNAYVKEPRMTQDVDVASTRAAEEWFALNEGIDPTIAVPSPKPSREYKNIKKSLNMAVWK